MPTDLPKLMNEAELEAHIHSLPWRARMLARFVSWCAHSPYVPVPVAKWVTYRFVKHVKRKLEAAINSESN